MKTYIKLTVIFTLIIVLFSCKSEREKRIETINKESVQVFSSAIAQIMLKGYNVNTDSLMMVFTKIAADSAELGLIYAKRVRHAVALLNEKENETGVINEQSAADKEDNISANKKIQQFEIVSHNQKIRKEVYGKNTCSIYVVVKNNSNKAIDWVFLKATWFDKNNNVVAVQTGYDRNIDPGAKSTIEIFTTEIQKKYRYELKIDEIDYK